MMTRPLANTQVNAIMTKASALTLNWGEPYGTIHGRLEDRPAALYEQNGFLFDGAGKIVLTKEEKAEQTRALEAQLASLKASDVSPDPAPVPVEEPQPALVEVRDGVTGDVEVKEADEEKKDSKGAKPSGKGKAALPNIPE